MLIPVLIPAALLAQAPATPRPTWVDGLPQEPGRLYALGTADLGASEAQAIARASDRAKLEVVARLRTTVKGESSVVTQTSQTRGEGGAPAGYGARSTRDAIQVNTKAEDLPGLAVERTYVDTAARTVFALAYLDIAQAESTLRARLAGLREIRQRTGEEASRKARWRLRNVMTDVVRLEELANLLATTGAGEEVRTALQTERQLITKRLAQLDAMPLPPLDLSNSTLALRCNVDLPAGIQDYLESRIKARGLQYREAGADFILELSFSGGGQAGDAFIFSEMTFAAGVLYRIEARLTLLDGNGGTLVKPASIQLIQGGSADGLVDQFRRQFERRLGRLLVDLQDELK